MEVARASHPERVAAAIARASSIPVVSLLQQSAPGAHQARQDASESVHRQDSARSHTSAGRFSTAGVSLNSQIDNAAGSMRNILLDSSVAAASRPSDPVAVPVLDGQQPVQLDYTPPSPPSANYDSRLPDFLAHLVYHHLLSLPFEQVISHSALLSSGSNVASLVRKVLNVTNLSSTEIFVGLIFLQRLLSLSVSGAPGNGNGNVGSSRVSPDTSPVHLPRLSPSHLLADLSTTHVLVRRLVILCFHLSNKSINDQPYSTRSWSRASGLSVEDLVAAERDALAAMEWRASVSIEEWDVALDEIAALGHDWSWALDHKGVSVRQFDVAKGCNRLGKPPGRISTESLQDGDSAVFDIDKEMGSPEATPAAVARSHSGTSSYTELDEVDALGRVKRPGNYGNYNNINRTPDRAGKHPNPVQYFAPQAYQPGTPVRLSFEMVRTADVSSLGATTTTPPYPALPKAAGPSNLREPQASHLARPASIPAGHAQGPGPVYVTTQRRASATTCAPHTSAAAYSLVPVSVQPLVPAAAAHAQMSGVAMPMPVHMVAYHGETSTGVRFVQYR
ncbi:hypothetical protein M427DRAFT_66421 [Gonapodya prolifera JEL478]|uniref:Uncharacterized protein n=1 Tax=Gonapodya prolifera (strain JEL478) TaxID=1344416 RepID=A0A139AUJ8_GONPJ|nr:hypothetical protein M427DRAFT_66421 [Gonapodya prolifera JEL478]|eukprot:KXS20402.1 hypothetical protein M427DRAFT_66421 [Gonapodya prolifera JEL478]